MAEKARRLRSAQAAARSPHAPQKATTQQAERSPAPAGSRETKLTQLATTLDEEAEPRSGAGRAAADDKAGQNRAPAKNEAFYVRRWGDQHHKEPEDVRDR